jgi:hypothetical protein
VWQTGAASQNPGSNEDEPVEKVERKEITDVYSAELKEKFTPAERVELEKKLPSNENKPVPAPEVMGAHNETNDALKNNGEQDEQNGENTEINLDSLEDEMEESSETSSFSPETIVNMYYKVDEKTEQQYHEEISKAFLKDVNLVQKHMEEKDSNKKKTGLSGLLGTQKTEPFRIAHARLEKLFPDEFGKEDNELPDFDEMKDKFEMLVNTKGLYEVKQEYPNDYEGTEEFQKCLDSIPGRLLSEDGEPKGTAKEYYAAIKEGYRGTFNEWNDEKPRGGIAALFYNFMKRLRESGLGEWLKGADWAPSWLKKLVGADLDDDETADRLKDSEIQKSQTERKTAIEKAAAISKNKEDWFNLKNNSEETEKMLLTTFNDFRGSYKEMFSFIAGAGKDEDLSKIEKADDMPADFGEISQENLQAWTGNKNAMAILQKFEGSKSAISLESWEKIIEHSGEFEITNNEIKLKFESGTEKVFDAWSEKGITELFNLPEGEESYNKYKTAGKISCDYQDLPKGVFTSNDKGRGLDASLISLLELGSEQWGAHVIDKDDIERFNKYLGGAGGFRRGNLRDGESDAFYTDFTQKGRLFLETSTGKTGKWFTHLSGDEIKKEAPNAFAVEGTGRALTKDYKFESVAAFFKFLENGKSAFER